MHALRPRDRGDAPRTDHPPENESTQARLEVRLRDRDHLLQPLPSRKTSSMQERRVREPRVGGNPRPAYLREWGVFLGRRKVGKRESKRVWPSPTRDLMAI